MGNIQKAMSSYRAGLPLLKQEAIDDGLCETYLGKAKAFQTLGSSDSALYYAKLSLQTAQQAGVVDYRLAAAAFLTDYYKTAGKVNSAYRIRVKLKLRHHYQRTRRHHTGRN